MAKKWAKKLYNSKSWQDVRQRVIIEQDNICYDCGEHSIDEVHHIKKLTPTNIDDPMITLNLDNLIGLCFECHKKRHESDLKKITREGYRFDNQGQLIYDGEEEDMSTPPIT